MKITSGVEQAICILLMLASQHDGLPLKSVTLSTRLQVSESYLKKVLRKLVVGGLINSSASKTGGFSLAKSDESITLLEVFEAIEGSDPFFVPSNLVEKVFLMPETIEKNKNTVITIISEAETLYKNRLKQCTLRQLRYFVNNNTPGTVDWNVIVEKGLL
ncbi:Rrf2 family transcriptional regulator [Acetobacterium paludosum]|uniref:Rrf2 family transcriptional regulator n=1 Tax=Acetobacterium paludosum TaxID=52693 RepID=A0A923I2F9_9FIRM|nr:Rrf2 family transcriptional regulator [Acetobacterium paludosum]MBC3888778.1 Rrf2 family transcriptional regulator [Acetobacterium paludosum]